MLSCEGVGKNIEQAINNALFELKATREDVDIKILDEGGFFRKAKVLLTISEEAKEKYQKVETVKEEFYNTEKEALADEKENKIKDSKLIMPKHDKEAEVDCIKSKDKFIDKGEDLDKAKTFTKNILEVCGINADVISEENKEEIFLNLVGASNIIGFRGEGINAFQYLINVYVGKNNRHAKKVRLDIDGYRKKREDTLIALAQRLARKVAKTGHSVSLEPMSANERRIIHTALAEDRFVETFSKGEEPYRHLIIKLKDTNKTEE